MSEELKRRMPEYLQPYLLRMQGNKVYLPAQFRVVWFREECPDWSIQTEIVEGGMAEGFATVKATIRNAEGKPLATAHKTETLQDFAAGFVEKAETGAVARALAFVGFGAQYAVELDEGEHVADAPVQRPVQPPAAAVPAKPSAPVGKPVAAASGPGFGKQIDYRARAAAHADAEIIALNARLKELAQEAGVDPSDTKAVTGMIAWHLGIDEREVKRPKDMSKDELKHLIGELEQALKGEG
jgi:hypothetical protein